MDYMAQPGVAHCIQKRVHFFAIFIQIDNVVFGGLKVVSLPYYVLGELMIVFVLTTAGRALTDRSTTRGLRDETDNSQMVRMEITDDEIHFRKDDTISPSRIVLIS